MPPRPRQKLMGCLHHPKWPMGEQWTRAPEQCPRGLVINKINNVVYIYINQDPSFPHIVIVERGHLLLLQQCDLCWRHSKVPIFFEECDCPGVRVPRCHDCKRYLHRLSLAHLGIPLDRQDGFNVHLYVPLSGGNLCGQRNFNGREPSLLYLGGIFVLV